MSNELLDNLDKIHTTELGVIRIKRNLGLDNFDVMEWCKRRVSAAEYIIRKGKNWYVSYENIVITINAYNYTIITAHKVKE